MGMKLTWQKRLSEKAQDWERNPTSPQQTVTNTQSLQAVSIELDYADKKYIGLYTSTVNRSLRGVVRVHLAAQYLGMQSVIGIRPVLGTGVRNNGAGSSPVIPTKTSVGCDGSIRILDIRGDVRFVHIRQFKYKTL